MRGRGSFQTGRRKAFSGAVEGDWAQEGSREKVPSAIARVRRAGHMTYLTALDAHSFPEKSVGCSVVSNSL